MGERKQPAKEIGNVIDDRAAPCDDIPGNSEIKGRVAMTRHFGKAGEVKTQNKAGDQPGQKKENPKTL